MRLQYKSPDMVLSFHPQRHPLLDPLAFGRKKLNLYVLIVIFFDNYPFDLVHFCPMIFAMLHMMIWHLVSRYVEKPQIQPFFNGFSLDQQLFKNGSYKTVLQSIERLQKIIAWGFKRTFKALSLFPLPQNLSNLLST